MMHIFATIRTTHEKPNCIAAALKPDNLSVMVTVAHEKSVVTTIKGDQLRSIIASIDDYLMNLAIAEDICEYGSS